MAATARATQSSNVTRTPIGEVIMDFADGGSYTKSKLDQHVLAIEERWIRRQQAKEAAQAEVAAKASETGGSTIREEDVDHLTTEFPIPASSARWALTQSSGNLEEAISLIIRTPGIPGQDKEKI